MGCRLNGDIGDSSQSTELGSILTLEECHFQCKFNAYCFPFKFDKGTKHCFIYGKGAVDKYEYHDPLQAGPKQCEPYKQFHFKST